MDEILYLTFNLIDRFLAIQSVVRKKLQLVGVTAMLLACKYEEVSVPVVDDLIQISDRAYSRQEVIDMEKLIVNILQFNLSLPTPYIFMRHFLKAAQSDKKMELLSYFLIELCLVEYEMLQFPPSLLAAAAIFTADCTISGYKKWSKTCEKHTCYTQDQLLECGKLMVSFHQKAGSGKLTGVHKKYSTSKFGPLQDFCVAVNDSNAAVFVNGKICKDPKMVTAEDFFFAGLNKPGDTSNAVGSKVTPVNVNQLPGLNTLGVSLVRIDYAPYGLNPPHTHPRATEILVVVEGTLYVGFVTSNPADATQKNKLFTKTLYPGDVFVFPEGLIHFQFNTGKTNAVAFAGLSSQNPGVITVANAVFGSDPPISRDVLTKAFQIDANVVKYLQGQFWMNNN
ncbi:hypothetical protein ACS0TY_025242 [Phlomoides rotata]